MLTFVEKSGFINPLNAELNPICHLLALIGAHHIFHVSRIKVKATMQSMHQQTCSSVYLTKCTVLRVLRL